MIRVSFFALALFWAVSLAAVEVPEFRDRLDPFLERHCYECHDDVMNEGGLDLFALGADLKDPETFARWERVYDRVTRGEMPPEKRPRPDSTDLSAFRRFLSTPLAEAHESRKGTVLRRLNRREYENTLNDIFGTSVDLVALLPEDGRSHEFDNVGKALGISMVQMERYLEGISAVLDAAIARQESPPKVETIRANYVDTREGERHIPGAWGKAPDGSVLFFRKLGYPSGMLRDSRVARDGIYRVKITGYAYRSEEPITFSVSGTSFARGSAKPTYGYFAFEPGAPQTVEFTCLIRENYMVNIEPWGLEDEGNIIRENKTTEGYPGPGLAIREVVLEGPLTDEFPGRGHRLLFDGINRTVTSPGARHPTFEVRSSDPRRDAASSLHRVANRAFRRPVPREEIAPFLELFEEQYLESNDFEAALRAAVSAIFVSPKFLYLIEEPGYLDDHAIANRLSYALNRTLPDEELLAAAAAGRLARDPVALWQQAERLMAKPDFERFIVDFTDAWLDLRNIDFTAPDDQLYPEFDAFLQYSIVEETRAFLRELLDRNLPARQIVKSEFAMLNNRLAMHYGIEGVRGPEVRRVPLPEGSVRGGFLSQASVLKVSANGTNTSPVLRGVWVLERILGQTPPPPPPGIPGVEPDIRGAETLRNLLEKHRSSESCQSCHEMIDPPGFALESFNPIGGWRDHYRSLGSGERVNLEVDGRNVRYRIGPPVDPSGQLADGASFADFNEFRDLLLKDEDRIARSFATKLLVFFTGREMGFSDRPAIHQIVRQSGERDHGMRDLVKAVVCSEIFRRK